MKTLMQTIVLILITSIGYGQEIVGRWEGALSVQGKQIRVILHVDKANNQYEATLDSPDQNASGIKVTLANLNYPKFLFEIPSLGAVYEGIVSNNSMSGKWVQSGTALFLALLRKEDPSNNGK